MSNEQQTTREAAGISEYEMRRNAALYECKDKAGPVASEPAKWFYKGYDAGFRAGAASRWVPVSERMPPNSDRVDVSVCSADGDNFVESDVGWNGREWWNADYDGPVEDGGDVVTAWRPRPEPFRGE